MVGICVCWAGGGHTYQSGGLLEWSDCAPIKEEKNNKSMEAIDVGPPTKALHFYSDAFSLLRSYSSWRQSLTTLSGQ